MMESFLQEMFESKLQGIVSVVCMSLNVTANVFTVFTK